MDQSLARGGNPSFGGNTNPNGTTSPSNAAATDDVEGAAQTVHRTLDNVEDQATSQVDRLSGAAHQAVNAGEDLATSAAQLASTLPEQAAQIQTRITEAACNSIRARPIATVAGAALIGYMLGRRART